MPDTDRSPVIARLEPVSGPTGIAYPIEVTVHGLRFAATGNVVTFGNVSIPNLPSSDGGTRMTFSVPKETQSRGEVPPFVLQAGDYPVTVTTPNGVSNAVVFVLTRDDEIRGRLR